MPQSAPARHVTRPRNRRELILAAAAELFSAQGYAKLVVGDLAEAVGITPSALYRHFTGKQQILATVLADGLAPVREFVGALNLTEPAAIPAGLAACSLDHRHLGLMWQREARNLDRETYQPVKDAVREIGQKLADYVRTVRPELTDPSAGLLAWSILAVLTSPSFHRLDLPRPAFDELLAELASAVLSTGLPDPPAAGALHAGARPALVPASRREALLTEAVRMFAARGYAEVSIEEIGGAVGIAGPSVYNHWPAKLDLLTTALRRAAAALAMDVATAYRQALGPADALRRVLRSFVSLSYNHPEIFSLLITDIDHLPDDELHDIRRAQREHVSEWVHLLRLHQPHLDAVTARVRVHAVHSVASDTARIPHLRRDPGVPAAVEAIGVRLLGLPN